MKKKILSVIVSSSLLILSSCGAVNTSKPVDTTANSSQEVINNTPESNTNSNSEAFVDTRKLDKLIMDIEYLKRQLDNDLFDDEYEFERRYDAIDDRYERISDRYYIDDDRANTNVQLPLNEFKELENIKMEFENLLKTYKQKYNVN